MRPTWLIKSIEAFKLKVQLIIGWQFVLPFAILLALFFVLGLGAGFGYSWECCFSGGELILMAAISALIVFTEISTVFPEKLLEKLTGTSNPNNISRFVKRLCFYELGTGIFLIVFFAGIKLFSMFGPNNQYFIEKSRLSLLSIFAGFIGLSFVFYINTRIIGKLVNWIKDN